MKTIANINFKNLSNLENDNVFVPNEIKLISDLTGMQGRKGLEKAVISNGKIVNFVSDGYGHLPNDVFFGAVEDKLNQAGIKFVKRSINRNDCSFAIDYILNDDSFAMDIKIDSDTVVPMLRFVNSYDGSNKTSGTFAIYRKVCSNGLHTVKETGIGFSVKHRGNIASVVMPEIGTLVNTFIENEYYELRKKFEVLAERPITNLNDFVKLTANSLGLFKFEKSDKNAEPSLNAEIVMDTIIKESNLLGVAPNMWLGYNAFNEILHTKFKKSFEQQKTIDSKVFDFISELA